MVIWLCCVCAICVVFVFFFKQKTAYEMRISDWSSDVCSSDLASVAAKPGVAALPEFAEAGVLLAITYSIREGRRGEFFDLMRELKPLLNTIEIGRASCRERVCQYV